MPGQGRQVVIDALDGANPTLREERPKFQSPWLILLTCLGCAVGTGNIWRFPRVVANNSQEDGGLVFIIVWILFLGLWSIPMLVIEYGIGRNTQKGVVGSFRELISDKAAGLGAWIVMVSFMISCYYSVILGWCFYYMFYLTIKGLPDSPEESRKIFKDYAEDSSWPVLTTFGAILLAGLCVVKGIKSIEKASMILVPVLLVIILACFGASLSLSHASVGIKYLFKPHWESFGDIQLWIDALSQNAFDTGAGAGLMVSYASYMTDRHGIVRYATFVPMLNNAVSLICGITIFAAVFATLISTYGYMTQNDIIDILMDSGPGSTGLTFIWLPVLFNTFHTVGRVISFFFFFCLSCAGLTSLIANVELFTLTLTDLGVPRKAAVPVCLTAMFLISLMSALNVHILNNQDFVWGFGLVINGLVFVSLVMRYGVGRFRTFVVNNFGYDDFKLPSLWKWMVMFVLPLEGVGLVIWWAADLIINSSDYDDSWDELGERTFVTTIIEWAGLAFAIFVVCVTAVLYRRRRRHQDTTPILQAASLTGSYDSGRVSDNSAACAEITRC